ncbi:hypothetical protein VNO77_19338 [Canavalia gladiata]|uniref:Uncharacterized protein n=1 Tax=Canavalia gladiata TaxID=3824 RepID=A0AAN9LM88_CANGL
MAVPTDTVHPRQRECRRMGPESIHILAKAGNKRWRTWLASNEGGRNHAHAGMKRSGLDEEKQRRAIADLPREPGRDRIPPTATPGLPLAATNSWSEPRG